MGTRITGLLKLLLLLSISNDAAADAANLQVSIYLLVILLVLLNESIEMNVLFSCFFSLSLF